MDPTYKNSTEKTFQDILYWEGKFLQKTGYYYTHLPIFSLRFSELNEQNLMPVEGSGEDILGRYEIAGEYDPSLCYLRLKQTYERFEKNIKLTWSPERNQFEGIYTSSFNNAGTFYIKTVKERIFDSALRLEDIL